MTLFLYFLAYYLTVYVWGAWRVYQRTGHNSFVLAKGDDAHGYVGRAFTGVVLAVAVVVISNAFAPQTDYWWGPLMGMQSSGAAIVGWCLLWLSLVWLMVAQYQMGVSWRVGFDNDVATDLVEIGLFKRSRNPIFLGMRLNLLGLFLVLPNTATACIAVAGELVIQVQVRLEEAFLAARHGEAYRAYQGRVRRWL